MHEFKHPKYYKELQASLKKEAISPEAHDGERGRAPKQQASSGTGPGAKLQTTSHKLPGPRPISNANKGLIHKRKAASVKHQADPDT